MLIFIVGESINSPLVIPDKFAIIFGMFFIISSNEENAAALGPNRFCCVAVGLHSLGLVE